MLVSVVLVLVLVLVVVLLCVPATRKVRKTTQMGANTTDHDDHAHYRGHLLLRGTIVNRTEYCYYGGPWLTGPMVYIKTYQVYI